MIAAIIYRSSIAILTNNLTRTGPHTWTSTRTETQTDPLTLTMTLLATLRPTECASLTGTAHWTPFAAQTRTPIEISPRRIRFS